MASITLTRRTALSAALGVSLAALALGASAQESAPQIDKIHFIVPGGAGGGWDGTARGTGEALTNAGLVGTATSPCRRPTRRVRYRAASLASHRRCRPRSSAHSAASRPPRDGWFTWGKIARRFSKIGPQGEIGREDSELGRNTGGIGTKGN